MLEHVGMASISIENVRNLYGAVEASAGFRSTLPLANSSSSLSRSPLGMVAGPEVISNGAIRIRAKPGDRMQRFTENDQILLFDGATGGHFAP